VSFAELLDDLVTRSGHDDSFLGSNDHLARMRNYVAEVDPEITVEWSADRSLYQEDGRLIAIARPRNDVPREEAAEETAPCKSGDRAT
jgi:hypothetical protein